MDTVESWTLQRSPGKGLNFNPQLNPRERPLKQPPGRGATPYALEARFLTT